ncbi:hypothetical protein MDA_GLEAN10000520 [Myotis davidii]|uniref:Uncharacterized protein n=1 Tax=Myotis davidii TaxID=225400 RepID=L5LBC1_MYODS|nr:hypothetical protein MDA_GLEAN10000520 [Myotis davidii]
MSLAGFFSSARTSPTSVHWEAPSPSAPAQPAEPDCHASQWPRPAVPPQQQQWEA